MTTLHKPNLAAACLLLALAATVAVAQTEPTKPAAKPTAKSSGKTLSGKTASGGKLMTRDELRSCLKRLDDINQGTKDIEAQRPPLDRERDELKAAGEALKAERAELDRQLVTVREWEAKTRTLAADIETFNRRSATVADAPRKEQEKLTEELKVERERLTKERATLTADEATLVPAYQNAAKAYNERATARDAKVEDWNKRNRAAVDAAQEQEEARALWLKECANRPYLEDDEKAVKAGK
jgi:chromosome segregation ATPase